MLARTADNLFWMSRYMERIDFVTKTLLVGFSSNIDYGTQSSSKDNWRCLAKMLYSNFEDFNSESKNIANDVFRMLTIKDDNNSLKDLISKARENARGIQEHITKEVWENINKKYHQIININPENIIKKGNQTEFLFNLFDDNMKYMGIVQNTIHRGEGWDFMTLGRLCERSSLTLSISEEKFRDIDINGNESNNILYWKIFLLNLSGFEYYLKNYRLDKNADQVLDLVIFNKEFNKSLSFTLLEIKRYISRIIQETPNPNTNKLIKEIGRLNAKINYSDLENVKENGVINFFEDIKASLYKLTKTIGEVFFSYY
ncbi:MAG: alpha-E domain-containing protein [Flavobacteriales bacterium]|nr:alpha-E domain-containing protein [Flavobacteriales bacterium]